MLEARPPSAGLLAALWRAGIGGGKSPHNCTQKGGGYPTHTHNTEGGVPTPTHIIPHTHTPTHIRAPIHLRSDPHPNHLQKSGQARVAVEAGHDRPHPVPESSIFE